MTGHGYYYLYAKNIQGDVVALYRRDINADGTRSATHIANYEYNPWGKILSIKNAASQDITNYVVWHLKVTREISAFL